MHCKPSDNNECFIVLDINDSKNVSFWPSGLEALRKMGLCILLESLLSCQCHSPPLLVREEAMLGQSGVLTRRP